MDHPYTDLPHGPELAGHLATEHKSAFWNVEQGKDLAAFHANLHGEMAGLGEMFVVIAYNPADLPGSFEAHGPFSTEEEASAYMLTLGGGGVEATPPYDAVVLPILDLES